MIKSIHENSLKAYGELNRIDRYEAILTVFKRIPGPLTDRDVMRVLGFTDMNSVRPRLSELIEKGQLKECGTVRDYATGKTVRQSRLVTEEEQTQQELF